MTSEKPFDARMYHSTKNESVVLFRSDEIRVTMELNSGTLLSCSKAEDANTKNTIVCSEKERRILLLHGKDLFSGARFTHENTLEIFDKTAFADGINLDLSCIIAQDERDPDILTMYEIHDRWAYPNSLKTE